MYRHQANALTKFTVWRNDKALKSGIRICFETYTSTHATARKHKAYQ